MVGFIVNKITTFTIIFFRNLKRKEIKADALICVGFFYAKYFN